MGIRNWFNPKNNKTKTGLDLSVEWASIIGPAEIDNLFIRIADEEIIDLMDAWNWLPINHMTIIATSAFGDVFFQNDLGEVHYIDTIEGKLAKAANSMSEFKALFQQEDARDHFLLAGFVMAARANGLILTKDECYDFKIAPILGGEMTLDQIEKTPISVKLHIAGQIHEQVKNLPVGSKIDKITID